MDPLRWKKIEDIFQEALDLSGKEREEFIRAETGDDKGLRVEVENLIARFEKEESFLESPVWTDSQFVGNTFKKEVASSLENELASLPSQETFSNRKIGVYLLTNQLGKGGMGVVYAAERADGEFRQKVAIKLIKRGMDTDFIVRRFRHERQILANFNHPNIASLLDGGTTADGLPYFVMEYIEGKPFFKYCEANEVDLRERLRIFLAVCDAIAYAHDKKIIHRDIKPGNILIGKDATPKLLDFGIAKILDPDSIHESVMPTATQMRLMTPEYASPEQARGDDITPASDQYSLGVLLFELVTGARPYKFPSRAPHEIARVICEEEPTNPSSADYFTGGSNAGEKEKAEAYAETTLDLKEDFYGKLDRIILKTLRKDPIERYESVRELSADLERLLENLPVTAESFPSVKQGVSEDNQSAKTGSEPKSIAVLPFQILNRIKDEETGEGGFLEVGLADALITRLSNVKQFVVRPTSSILQFNTDKADAFIAGEELKVEYVLTGSILRSGEKIRVSVQLFKVANHSVVWAERFDESFTDVLNLEDKISAKVAEALVPQLAGEELEKLAKRGTDNAKAYEAYLRGRYYWNTFTENSFAQAFSSYQEAISHDSNYALAYAGIADYYIWLGVYGILPPKSCYPPSKDAARRAIQLDDGLADAYASLGFAQLCGDYDWVEAEKNALRAIELNPNYAVARLWYSYILQTAGRYDEGIEQASRAVALDPLSYTNRHVLAWAYYFARRYEDAVAQADVNVRDFPAIGLGYFTQSWVLRYLGSHEEAVAIAQKAIDLSGGSLFILLGYGQALAASGDKAKTEETLQKIYEQGKTQYLSYYQVALIQAYAGDNQKALDALERAYEDREGWLIWMRSEPALDKLRREPRFINLRKQVDSRIVGTKFEDRTVQEKTSQKSLAVLPLNVIDDTDDDAQFLSLGLADALITKLSNVKQFTVRPTSSILRFSEKNVDALAAGRELSVEYLLSGNVLRGSGGRIRISLQLLTVANRATVWAERFDEKFTDFLSLEDEVSAKVAEALVPQLTTGERQELAKRGTNNSEAHEAYLRGRFHWNAFTQDSLKQSIQFYQKAVALDPNYALAYAGIADYFIWLGIFGALSPAKSYQPAKQMAQKAIALDESLAEAHAALGFAQLCGDYNWKESEENIRRAIKINPNYAVAHNWLAIQLYTAGRFEEGLEHARKSIELDPLTYQNYRTLSWGFYFSRRYDEALIEVNRSIEKFPNTGTALANRSWLLRSMGKPEEATRDSEKALKTAGGNLFVVLGHAQSLAASGQLTEAEKIVAETEAQAAMRYVSYYQISLVYCYAKQKEKALAALEHAYEDREGWLVWLDVEPALDFLRNEPRFLEILKKVNPDSPTVKNLKAIPQAAETSQKIVAVLPFRVLNAVSEPETGDDAFLGIGLADALITRLSNVRQFVVRPTSSVLSFNADDFDSFTAGRELNVNFVLDGNILRSGNKIRVSIQLLDIAARSTVWAERFDEDFTDALQLEDAVSAKVIDSLVPQLTGEERKRLEKHGTENIQAFEAYLRGRFHWNTFTDDGFRQAIYFYRKAIELDPNYALAHAAIADYYVMLGIYNVLPSSEFYPPAKEAALRAIELDHNLSEAYTALGLTRLYGEFEWQASEANFRYAIELNPNNPIAHLWFSHSLYTQGKFEEGTKHIDRALEIDPLSFQNHNTLAWSYFFQRQPDKAIEKMDEVISDFPAISHSYFGKGCFLCYVGKTDEALVLMQRALDLSKDSLFAIYGLALIYGAEGKRSEAEKLIEKTRTEKSKEYFSFFQTAQTYCYLKDKEKAFEFFEESYNKRESLLVWLAIEPSLDILRDDARYKSLLTKIKHPLAQSVKVSQVTESKTKSELVSISPEEIVKQETSNTLRYALIGTGVLVLIIILYLVITYK